MNQLKSISWFLLASVAISAVIYGSAMWGDRMLAPLDIGPDLFKNFRYMDPRADGIPDNHYIIDQFTYDLPLQYAIYQAYHAGEIPWWDPYTYGGRPLLADAHVNGTDPVRLLCYAVLPFEVAYNWNLILRGILTGLGMFLLLRAFKVNGVVAGILAITYQYAGWFTMYWGHPWIQGSFLYFPFLWVVWMRSMQREMWFNMGLGGLLCGLVFYAGNLQSHMYLPLFAISFLGAALVKAPRQFQRAFLVTAFSGLMGALLASPVLANQIEFFLHSERNIMSSGTFDRLLALPLSLSSYYPWMCGTFKTLDIGGMTKMNGMSFQLFCGIGCSCLALWGVWALRREKGAIGMAVCQSLFLIAIYLCVVSTPLVAYLYSRCSPLAGMGLVVLAALTTQAIIDRRVQPQAWLVRLIIGVVFVTSIGTSALTWWVYPIFKVKVEKMVIEVDRKRSAKPTSSPILRKHQIDGFPQEVSLLNPETATTLVALLLFAFALTRKDDKHVQTSLVLAFLVGALPVLNFHFRFRPSQSMSLWHQLVAGGPAQHEAEERLKGGLRLDESAMKAGDAIFPFATAAMYGVHVVQGYSAMQPCSLYNYPHDAAHILDGWRADYVVDPTGEAGQVPSFRKQSDLARFRILSTGNPASVRVSEESYNRLTLDASSLPHEETLVRTDTYYPGWFVRNGDSKVNLEKQGTCFSTIPQLREISDGKIKLEYQPSYLSITYPCSMIGMLFVAASLFGDKLLRFCRGFGKLKTQEL